MNIVVCVKLIPDPEAPVQHYQMAADGRTMETMMKWEKKANLI